MKEKITGFFSIPYLLIPILLLFQPPLSAESLDSAAHELARKIVAAAGTGENLSLTVRNISAVSPAAIVRLRSALERELGIAGGGPAQADPVKVQVTISENLQAYVLVAEIPSGDERRTEMVTVPRSSAADLTEPSSSIAIERRLLWEQTDPMLDIAVLERPDGRRHLLVLEPGRVTVYERRDREWKLAKSLAMPDRNGWPRDLRGRLVAYGDSFRTYLPGLGCKGRVLPEPQISCEAAAAPWPLHAAISLYGYPAAGRNYFESFITTSKPQKDVPPFFSIAEVQTAAERSWLLAALDGSVRLFDHSLEPVKSWDGWGSDIAALRSACGTGWQVMAVTAGDGHEADSVQAYELVQNQASAVSQPVRFSGPVTAFWPSGTQDVIAVVKNPNGRYAAYSLAISCGH